MILAPLVSGLLKPLRGVASANFFAKVQLPASSSFVGEELVHWKYGFSGYAPTQSKLPEMMTFCCIWLGGLGSKPWIMDKTKKDKQNTVVLNVKPWSYYHFIICMPKGCLSSRGDYDISYEVIFFGPQYFVGNDTGTLIQKIWTHDFDHQHTLMLVSSKPRRHQKHDRCFEIG